jgi:hypothetical protein
MPFDCGTLATAPEEVVFWLSKDHQETIPYRFIFFIKNRVSILFERLFDPIGRHHGFREFFEGEHACVLFLAHAVFEVEGRGVHEDLVVAVPAVFGAGRLFFSWDLYPSFSPDPGNFELSIFLRLLFSLPL